MRTFIAIDLPDSLKQAIAEEQTRLQSQLPPETRPHIRWTDASKLHLTLRFLGETTAAQRTDIETGLADLVHDHDPFQLQLGGLGVFPHWRRISVVWTGVTGEMVALHHLQEGVEAVAQHYGFEAEGRDYHPHITLARIDRGIPRSALRPLGTALQAVAQQENRPLGQWTVSEIIYMQSQLRPAGAVYTPLATFDLA